MFDELAALLLMSREFGHRAHLRSPSFSQHKALETFYTDLVDLTDSLIEAYQGRSGMAVAIKSCALPEETDPVAVLRSHLKIIEGVRYQAIANTDAPLQSLVDNICCLYLQTIYKLTLLN